MIRQLLCVLYKQPRLSPSHQYPLPIYLKSRIHVWMLHLGRAHVWCLQREILCFIWHLGIELSSLLEAYWKLPKGQFREAMFHTQSELSSDSLWQSVGLGTRPCSVYVCGVKGITGL